MPAANSEVPTSIGAVMTAMPHTVGPDQSLKIAKDMMHKLGIRHLPVKELGRIVGILSDRDIDFALRVDNKTPEELVVKDAFTADVFSVLPEVSIGAVADRMAKDRIGCALVEKEGRLLGIFTTVDACRVLSETLANRK